MVFLCSQDFSPSSALLTWLNQLLASTQLVGLLNRQLEVVQVETWNNEMSFLDFAQLLVDLFANGKLKRLKLFKALPLIIPQTLENFQQGLTLLVKRFPQLIHLSVRMRPCGESSADAFNWTEMTTWLSTQAELKLGRHCHWRCLFRLVELWL